MVEQISMAHVPGLHKEPGMLYEFWEDGELTLTKAGDLYRQRGLHMIAFPLELPKFVVQTIRLLMDAIEPSNVGCKHARIFLRDHETADELRKAIQEYTEAHQ